MLWESWKWKTKRQLAQTLNVIRCVVKPQRESCRDSCSSNDVPAHTGQTRWIRPSSPTIDTALAAGNADVHRRDQLVEREVSADVPVERQDETDAFRQ